LFTSGCAGTNQKTYILFAANSNWTTDGISLAQSLPQQSPFNFHQHYEVVFIDVTGSCNFCADMTKETFFWVCILLYDLIVD
jgi:Nrap protein.